MADKILEEAETLKKRADILFATNKLELAIETYTQALRRLAFVAGYSVGELCVIRCFSNQAQCYLKMNQYDKALASINMAFTVPSVAHDGHMLSKLWYRKAIALESLDHCEEALASLDRVIALGIAPPEEHDVVRNRIIKTLVNKAGLLIPIPPKPVPIPQSIVNATITRILISHKEVDKLSALLQTLIKQRAWMDCEDDRKNNIMWALCQAAIIRAQDKDPSLESDGILPLLEQIIVEGGAMAEQRFHNHRNKTPLQMFAMAGAVQCVHTIMKYGGSTRTLDDDGWSPLIVACAPNGPHSGTNRKVVELFIRARANVNHVTKTGLTALAAAAQSNDSESVKLLLAAGASIAHRCDLGFSPLVWAKIGSDGANNESITVLLDHVNALSNADVKYEIQQDLRCFDLGKVLDILSRIRASFEAKDDEAKSKMLDIHHQLCNTIIQLCAVDIMSRDDHNSTSSYNKLEQLFGNINIRLVPDILKKRWLPKSRYHEDMEIALSNATPIEKHWQKILESAVKKQSTASDGDDNQQNDTVALYTVDDLDFYVVNEYQLFVQLIVEPIAQCFSRTIVSSEATTEIMKHSTSFLLLISHHSRLLSDRQASPQYAASPYMQPSEHWKHMRSLGCNITTSAVSLWEDDTVDVVLELLPKLSSTVTVDASNPAYTSQAMLVLEVENMVLESLLEKSVEARMKMFHATADVIIDQVVDAGSDIMIVGMVCEDGCAALFTGKRLLISQFTAVLIAKIEATSGCVMKQRIDIPSWPFENAAVSIYSTSSSGANSIKLNN